jgi:hypothetical protein
MVEPQRADNDPQRTQSLLLALRFLLLFPLSNLGHQRHLRTNRLNKRFPASTDHCSESCQRAVLGAAPAPVSTQPIPRNASRVKAAPTTIRRTFPAV